MTELQGAVALAQLPKLEEFKANGRRAVEIIEEELRDAPGMQLAYRYPGTEPNYWLYPVKVPESMGQYGEINYLEIEFQKMQRTRRTSVGYPLPDYVQYKPGICPNAEKATKGIRYVCFGRREEPENVRQWAIELREQVARVLSES